MNRTRAVSLGEARWRRQQPPTARQKAVTRPVTHSGCLGTAGGSNHPGRGEEAAPLPRPLSQHRGPLPYSTSLPSHCPQFPRLGHTFPFMPTLHCTTPEFCATDKAETERSIPQVRRPRPRKWRSTSTGRMRPGGASGGGHTQSWIDGENPLIRGRLSILQILTHLILKQPSG